MSIASHQVLLLWKMEYFTASMSLNTDMAGHGSVITKGTCIFSIQSNISAKQSESPGGKFEEATIPRAINEA